MHNTGWYSPEESCWTRVEVTPFQIGAGALTNTDIFLSSTALGKIIQLTNPHFFFKLTRNQISSFLIKFGCFLLWSFFVSSQRKKLWGLHWLNFYHIFLCNLQPAFGAQLNPLTYRGSKVLSRGPRHLRISRLHNNLWQGYTAMKPTQPVFQPHLLQSNNGRAFPCVLNFPLPREESIAPL